MAKLKTGDHVVYPPHGAGTITSREAGDDGTEYLAIEMVHNKLTLRVPAAIAEERGVRPVVSGAEAKRIIASLADPGEKMLDNPQHRAQQTARQTRTGGTEELAKILRDFTERERAGGKLSPVERKSFDNARQILAGELALARKGSTTEAEQWIDDALASGTSSS
jgi:CarD family transcriptional regulator